jgi:hypothetical protein
MWRCCTFEELGLRVVAHELRARPVDEVESFNLERKERDLW